MRTPAAAVLRLLLSLATCLLVTGCHHKQPVAVPPPVAPTASVPLVKAPEPERPALVQTVPVPPAPLPEASVQPPRVKKIKKKTGTDATGTPPAATATASAAPSGNQVAAVGPVPAALAIGDLSEGGRPAPEEKQRVNDAISGVEKRLSGLSAGTLDSQKEGVLRVRNFLRQAHEALNTGDAEGANTLATKAGLLLDDLLK